MNNKWYVKTRYPNDSVVGIYSTEAEAQVWADARNAEYQGDKYYVEAYDPEKAKDFVNIIDIVTKRLKG